jgi:hypothetical protein
MGLTRYSTAPASSALSFHSRTLAAVRTITGISDVTGSLLSTVIASTAIMSGRCKSVRIRSGRSANALLIPCIEVSAREVSYPASPNDLAKRSESRESSSTMRILPAMDAPVTKNSLAKPIRFSIWFHIDPPLGLGSVKENGATDGFLYEACVSGVQSESQSMG